MIEYTLITLFFILWFGVLFLLIYSMFYHRWLYRKYLQNSNIAYINSPEKDIESVFKTRIYIHGGIYAKRIQLNVGEGCIEIRHKLSNLYLVINITDMLSTEFIKGFFPLNGHHVYIRFMQNGTEKALLFSSVTARKVYELIA